MRHRKHLPIFKRAGRAAASSSSEIQTPGQREYYRTVFRDMVYAAFAD